MFFLIADIIYSVKRGECIYHKVPIKCSSLNFDENFCDIGMEQLNGSMRKTQIKLPRYI